MATIGVLTQHTTLRDGERVNRWWVDASALPDALNKAVDIVNAIKAVFGTTCQFNNVHAWIPGQNPNQFVNRPIAIPGLYTAANPTSAVVVARVDFAAGVGDYPNYKDFRVCINPDQQSGPYFNESFSNTMVNVLNDLDGLGFLVTKGGTGLTSPSYANTVRYRQLSKKWYNRAQSNMTLKQLMAVDA